MWPAIGAAVFVAVLAYALRYCAERFSIRIERSDS